MNSNKDNFLFTGFLPSDELKIYGKEVYSLLEDKAPSESKKLAQITKTNKGYEGSFRITSASGEFQACSHNNEPKNLMDEIYKEMSLQFLDWSKTRNLKY